MVALAAGVGIAVGPPSSDASRVFAPPSTQGAAERAREVVVLPNARTRTARRGNRNEDTDDGRADIQEKAAEQDADAERDALRCLEPEQPARPIALTESVEARLGSSSGHWLSFGDFSAHSSLFSTATIKALLTKTP